MKQFRRAAMLLLIYVGVPAVCWIAIWYGLRAVGALP
jgi:hypothetical protein